MADHYLCEGIDVGNSTPERWIPVRRYEGFYEVSDRGRVRSLQHRWGPRKTPLVLKVQRHPSGHLIVGLSDRTAKRTEKVHHLVLEAFTGQCPPGMEGCHGDGNPENNVAGNLRWDTRAANLRDAVRHGTHWMTAKTHCPKGHPYDEENTYMRPRGGRDCKTCMQAKRQVQTGKTTAARTHCPKGHEYTPENTKITSHGMRRCIACDELGLRKPRLKMCQRGHEMTGDNVHVTPDGRRRCKACQRLRDRRSYASRSAA